MKISFISTIFNEGATIENFLNSILIQSKKPDEVIIVDGGSQDDTISRLKQFDEKFKRNNIKFSYLIKKGNRSVGRNAAIEHATGDIIVCSDSGNELDKDWVRYITEPFENKNVDVVAGYYKGIPKNVFQKCVIPYALVMPDKIDATNFLPATRSLAMTKLSWDKVGGFDKKYSHNEDYVFARKLRSSHCKIVFAKKAIVYWYPRDTYKQAFVMIFRFAYGDAEAGIYRPKVLLIFTRYIIGILFLILAIIYGLSWLYCLVIIIVLLYCVWAITKNYRYVKQWQAFFILPALQIVSDSAVITGTIGGILKLWDIEKK